MPRTPTLCLLLLVVAACGSLPPRQVVPPVAASPRLVDIEHYDISVDLDHEAGFVDGAVAVHFRGLPGAPSEVLVLDAVELAIEGVWTDDGDELPFTLADRLLTIELPRPTDPDRLDVLHVEYSAYPRRGLFCVAPSVSQPDRPWHVWTQGQAEDTRHWMPVWDRPDERATHTLQLTVDERLLTLGAGERTRSTEHPRRGRRTDTWEQREDHVSYLITFVAGDLAEADLGDAAIALPVVAEAADLELALENLADTADMLVYFEQLTGLAYPFHKYSQAFVKEYTAGGMENVSATTLYYEGLHDLADEPQVDIDDLLAHELAHQWYGDLITCRSWSHLWLNEGFATFLEDLWMGRHHGPDEYQRRMLSNRRAYVANELVNSHPIVWDTWELPDDTFDDHAYPGGSGRLHLLRSILGDEAFFRGLRAYTRDFAGKVVDTDAFQGAMEAATGRDLSRFFDEWLHGPGFPVFRARIEALDTVPATEALRITQLQAERGWREVFHAPVTVAWSRDGVEHTERVELDAVELVVPLPGDGLLEWVRFDHGTTLPMRLDFWQPEASWRRQLLGAEDGVTRLLAAEWFAGSSWVRSASDWGVVRGDVVVNDPVAWVADDESVAALAHAARTDRFWPVRTTAVAALAAADHGPLFGLLEELAYDDDPRVRAAVADALAWHGGDRGLPLLLDLAEDANDGVAASAVGALVLRQHPGALALVERQVAEADARSWRRARDMIAWLPQLDDDVLPFLIKVSRRHEVPWVRVSALGAMGALPTGGPHDDVIHRELVERLGDRNFRVRGAAADALGARGDGAAVGPLRARASIEADPTVLGSIRDALTRL